MHAVLRTDYWDIRATVVLIDKRGICTATLHEAGTTKEHDNDERLATHHLSALLMKLVEIRTNEEDVRSED